MWRIIAYDRDGREVARKEIEGGQVTVGRDPDRDLMLPSTAVSRRHAHLVLDGPQPYVADEGSSNGVLVNGVRIGGPTAIVAGVRIDLADFHLEIEEGDPPTEAVQPIDDRPASYEASDVLRLVGKGGPYDGRVFELPPGELTLGRAVDNMIVLDDPSLSRKHARVRRASVGRIEVEDLGSSNGTYVNGRKVGRATAGPGDVVRFGDLIFRVRGANIGGDGTEVWKSALLWGGLVVLLLGVGALVVALFLKKPEGPSKDSLQQAAMQASEHVRAGKTKLSERKFDAATAEFDQAIELDPTNAEARRLKDLAEKEPRYERFARQVGAKADAGGDKPAFESAVRFLAQIPDESVFRLPTARKLSAKLSAFGEAQCKAKRWNDCAWALCKSMEVAPEDSRPPGAGLVAQLKDAEKKLARDRTYSSCKVLR